MGFPCFKETVWNESSGCLPGSKEGGIDNAIMVLIARTELSNLAHIERCYIQLLSPVFKVLGVSGEYARPAAVKRELGPSMSEDVRFVAAALLRKNRSSSDAEDRGQGACFQAGKTSAVDLSAAE